MLSRVCTQSHYVCKTGVEDIMINIEELREELNNKLISGSNNEETLKLSRELDKLIVEYFRMVL